MMGCPKAEEAPVARTRKWLECPSKIPEAARRCAFCATELALVGAASPTGSAAGAVATG